MNVYYAHPYRKPPTRGELQVAWTLTQQLWGQRVTLHPGRGVFQRHPVCRSWVDAIPFLLGTQPDGRLRYDAFISPSVDLGRFNAQLLEKAQQQQRPVVCLRDNALWSVRAVLPVDSETNPGIAGRLVLARVPVAS